MAADRFAHGHGGFDLALNEFEAFKLDLAPSHIQGCDDLIIWRGRRVRHVRLVERLFHFAFEVLIADMDHGTLTQRRQRLVG